MATTLCTSVPPDRVKLGRPGRYPRVCGRTRPEAGPKPADEFAWVEVDATGILRSARPKDVAALLSSGLADRHLPAARAPRGPGRGHRA